MNLSEINLNSSEITNQVGNIGSKAFSFFGKISEFVTNYISQFNSNSPGVLATLFTIFISLLFIFLGLKVVNKLIKFVLIILGIVLLLGSGYLIIKGITG